MQEGLKVQGRFRIALVEDSFCIGCDEPNTDMVCPACGGTETYTKIVGDSGWHSNLVTNLGFNEYLVKNLADGLTGIDVTHVALGTGAAPAAGDTTLSGEITHASNSRTSVTAASSSTSKTVRFTATFSSATSHNTATVNISNVGLFQQSNTNTATIFAGNTFASSSWATNQSVNLTYDVTFS